MAGGLRMCALYRDSVGYEQVCLRPLLAQPRPRFMTKDGRPTLRMHSSSSMGCWSYVRDIWSTLLSLRWRFMLLVFSAAFLLSWFVFALLWYLIAYLHGDVEATLDPEHVVCVQAITSLRAAFSFAVETQLTIGYGKMYPNGECPQAVALLTVQMILGLMLEALITGAFVAKLARPKLRSETLRFSHFAVVNRQGEQSCLQFRVANLLPSPLLHIRLQAVLYQTHGTELLHQTAVPFTLDHMDGEEHCPFFLSPLTYCHGITETSPFYRQQQVLGSVQPGLELVVFLTARDENTGEVCQKRTSYISEEILCNHCYPPAVISKEGQYTYNVRDFDRPLPEPGVNIERLAMNGAPADQRDDESNEGNRSTVALIIDESSP
ncbi:inward rectifier potassium channel 13-like isoform X1 [Lampetra planeri]